MKKLLQQKVSACNRFTAVLMTVAASVMLSGCGGDDLDDLREYVKEVQSRKKARIEPLPELKPYETFTYAAGERRDPFEPALRPATAPLATAAQNAGTSGLAPDLNRRKEALEEFPLDTLRMVGSLEQMGDIWAIIQANDGTIHRVKPGNYAGQNHGKVINITESKVDLIEIAPDGLGGWVEREASLALSE